MINTTITVQSQKSNKTQPIIFENACNTQSNNKESFWETLKKLMKEGIEVGDNYVETMSMTAAGYNTGIFNQLIHESKGGDFLCVLYVYEQHLRHPNKHAINFYNNNNELICTVYENENQNK